MKTNSLTFVLLFATMVASGKNLSQSATDNVISSDTKINSIADNEKFIWLGTDEGAYRINKKTNESMHITKGNSALPSNIVTSICCNEDGNVWIGTNDGILRFDNYAYSVLNSENTDLPDNHVTAMVIDKNNDLWIGTYFGGLMKVHNFSYHVYNQSNSVMTGNCVFSLSADDAGNIWVGLFQKGLLKIKGNEWQLYNSENSELQAATISFVVRNDNGNYCIGSYEQGVFSFDGKIFTKDEKFPIASNNIRFAYRIDSEDKWIIGCDDGVGVFNNLSAKNVNYNNFYSLLSSGYFRNANYMVLNYKKPE